MKPVIFVGTPFEGVGPVRFGMSREEVRSQLGPNFEADCTALSSSAREAWFDRCVCVEYDSDERCCAINVSQPCGLVVHGTYLGGMSAQDLVRWVESVDASARQDADGITSHVLGICVWVAPSQEHEPEELECPGLWVPCILMFARDYWSRSDGLPNQ